MTDEKAPAIDLETDDDILTGTLSIHLPPGISSEARAKLVDDALAEALDAETSKLSIVLAASPSRFVRERPGRDGEGRTVLDVSGRVEGDRLVPYTPARSRRR